MFFFKKPPPPISENTQVMPMLRSLLSRRVKCHGCRKQVDIAQLEPLSNIPCPHCEKKVFVPKQFREYWMYRFVGEGRRTSVYKAVSEDYPEEKFAIKVLKDRYKGDEACVERLCNDAQMINHFQDYPSIVTATEYGYSNTEEHYFLVMSFIEGQTVGARVARNGPYEEAEAVKAALDILQVQKLILRSGYLYRGLTPNSVIMRKDSPVFIDFSAGISLKDAMASQEQLEIDAMPHHVPPERLLGEGEDFTGEIYSLGTTLYYMLSGQTLFEGDDLEAVAERYAFADRRDVLSNVGADCSPRLAALVDKMVQRDPRDRLQSHERLEADLRACLN
jgi:serine/threonine-protein kinase